MATYTSSTSSSTSSSSNTTLSSSLPLSLLPLPSATPSHIQQNFSIKLNAKNYILWKLQFQPLLNFYNLHGVLDGMEHSPPKEIQNVTTAVTETNPAYLQWFAKDQLLFSWLLSSISEEVYPHLIELNSAHAV